MEILFLSKSRSASCSRISLGWGTLVLGLSVLFAGAAGLAGLALYAGVGQQAVTEAQVRGLLTDELHAQHEEIDRAKDEAERYMNSLSRQLGQMRASMLRLEALGKHLTEVAKLDSAEFDFENPPAMGGPQSPTAADINIPDFIQALKQLSTEIDDRSAKLEVMEKFLMNRELQTRIMPAGRPVTSGWLSSPFGKRTDPISGKKEFHAGVDIAGKEGSGIVAVADGVVSIAEDRSGYGNLVEINHGNGYVTRYGHNKSIHVAVGDKVAKGQLIAAMGSTGRSTGPHVHFEVIRNGKTVNPQKYVQAAR